MLWSPTIPGVCTCVLATSHQFFVPKRYFMAVQHLHYKFVYSWYWPCCRCHNWKRVSCELCKQAHLKKGTRLLHYITKKKALKLQNDISWSEPLYIQHNVNCPDSWFRSVTPSLGCLAFLFPDRQFLIDSNAPVEFLNQFLMKSKEKL